MKLKRNLAIVSLYLALDLITNAFATSRLPDTITISPYQEQHQATTPQLQRRDTECIPRSSTLKLLSEMPFSGLFRDLKGNGVDFEGSDITRVHGKFYVVFDSSYSIGILEDEHFSFRSDANRLAGHKDQESQFEGIAYVPENDTFLLLHETWSENKEFYQPYIATAKLGKQGDDYDIISRCPVDVQLTHENKGWEAISYVLTSKGEGFVLGLCEGNYCMGGRQGRESGNGRLVVAQLQHNDEGCVWKPVKTLYIPSSADFTDYSGLAPNYASNKLAILSQENAAVWIGDFDFETLEFLEKDDNGQVFHLPRNVNCDIIYCNAEGIQWIDDYRVVVVSDRAKKDQPWWCDAKDQSVHLFSLGRDWVVDYDDDDKEEKKKAVNDASGTGTMVDDEEAMIRGLLRVDMQQNL